MPPIAPQPRSLAGLIVDAVVEPLRLWDRRHFEEPFVVTDTPFGRTIVVCDPDAIRRILVDEGERYGRDVLGARIMRRVTGRSVFSAEGDDWRRQRRLLAPFFTPRAVGALHDTMAAAAEDVASELRSRAGTTIDMAAACAAATVEVLTRTFFPAGTGQSPAAIARSVRRFADIQGIIGPADLAALPVAIPDVRRLLLPLIGFGVRARAARVVARSIAGGRTAEQDLAAALVAAHRLPIGERLSTREISDTISMLFGAGTDTVALSLTWTLHLLASHPSEREAVEAEVDAVTGGGAISSDMLPRLERCRAAIEEAMRLYPPAPTLGRRALVDDRIGAIDVPAGTMIVIPPLVVHRHRLLWSQPDHFKPTRFLGEQREAIPRFAHLPFGAGPRVCLGNVFAQREAVLVLATLVRDLRFDAVPGRMPKLRQRITLQPLGGAWLTVTRR